MQDISTRPFDPCVWNLLAGVALITACGPGSLGSTEETSTSEGTSDTTESSTGGTETTGTQTGDGPECVNDDDCFYSDGVCDEGMCVECVDDDDCIYSDDVECINNNCIYTAPECGSHDTYYYGECGQFEICGDSDYCISAVDPPLPDCNTDVMGIPTALDLDAPPLALSFVDVDDDGQDELAVATETQLLVYEFEVPDPTATDRAWSSEVVLAMVSAQFDGQTGEDLMLLLNIHVHGYFSDGASGFVNPNILFSPIDMPQGLLAGDFDGQAPEDLWVWADSGARLYVGGVDLEVDIPGPEFEAVFGVAAFEYLSPYAGVLLGTWFNPELNLFDLAGHPLASEERGLNSVAAVSSPDKGRFVSAGYHSQDDHSQNWSNIRFRDASTLDQTHAFVGAGHPQLLAGDFDGDQRQEVLAVDQTIELIREVFDAPCSSTLELGIEPEEEILPAVGDHDGDGDDEFAVVSGFHQVIIVDVE